MQKKHKVMLIFSIVFWLLVLTGLLLFGYSLSSVRINKYGLLRNYYSSYIDTQVYISGVYHTGIGHYFIEFPSSKVYLNDLKLNVTNKDMSVMQVAYSLVYRLVKDQTYNLYQELSTDYESTIVATINSIVSGVFIDKNQQESKVTLQDQIVAQINANYGRKMKILQTATQIQAFWLNEIDYFEAEKLYETAYLDTAAISQAFTSMDVEMMKTTMQVLTIRSLMESLKDQITLNSQSAYRNSSRVIQQSADYLSAQKRLIISNRTKSAQILEYYPIPKIQFISSS